MSFKVIDISTDVQTFEHTVTLGEFKDNSANVSSKRVLLVNLGQLSGTDASYLTELAENHDWVDTNDGDVFYADADEDIHFMPGKTEQHQVWDWSQFAWIDPRSTQEKYDQAAAQVRANRNKLLQSSDWTQLQDISNSVRSAWVTYRQALRDISSQTGFPFNINWPEQPS